MLIRQLPVQFVKRPQNWKYAPLSMGTTMHHSHCIYTYNSTQRVCVCAYFEPDACSVSQEHVTGAMLQSFLLYSLFCGIA